MIREGKKLPANVENRIPGVIVKITQDPTIVAVYAFGSLTEGNLKPLSDLDFGVLISNALSKKQRFKKQLDLIGTFIEKLGTEEIDLVVLNDDPLRFAFHILKSGKLLYCRDRHQLVDFMEKTTKMYLDFKSIRKEFDEVFLEGIGYHG